VINKQKEILQAKEDYSMAKNGFEKANTWESQIAKKNDNLFQTELYFTICNQS
jgi:hypothetical protein